MISSGVKDLRTYYTSKLAGNGVDLGPLHRPMVKHKGMNVKYVDRLTVAEMRKHYPELSEMNLQEPDILCNGEYLDALVSRSQDFVIASHVLEHMKNPLRALQNWWEVCKPGGKIYLVVPDHRYIFDKDRPLTTLEHLIKDYWHGSDERDEEHFLEYATLVDGQKGERALAHAASLKERGYSIHYHTFVPDSLRDFLYYFSEHLRPLLTVEGPGIAKEDPHEFHFLLTVQKD